MSFFKNKSEFNLEGASLLIENNCYAPSVHCSYYSVLQLLKYKFVTLKDISYAVLSQKTIADNRNSHKYLIDEFCVHLRSEPKKYLNLFEVRALKRDIEDLKQFRVESDYENIEINVEKSTKALNLSVSIIKRIKNIR